jgi:hypothetical protein
MQLRIDKVAEEFALPNSRITNPRYDTGLTCVVQMKLGSCQHALHTEAQSVVTIADPLRE